MFFIYIYFFHIFIVLRIDLDFSSMRYLKIDNIIKNMVRIQCLLSLACVVVRGGLRAR